MPTIQVSLQGNFDEAALIARVLEDAFEAEGYPVTMEETPAYSNNWVVDTILFLDTEAEALDAVREVLGETIAGREITAKILEEDTNWIALSEEIRKPVVAGRFFLHGRHDRDKRPVNAISLEIDAELAFGTGHHASTWGCLAALDRIFKARAFDRPLDLGTGTGVLAIAAVKVLRVPVLATDIDPVSVKIAKANAHLNGVGGLIEAIVADGMNHVRLAQEAPYDLILANILARPLTRLAAPVARAASSDAVVVLAGLRVVDAPMVLSAWRMQGFRLQDSITSGDWRTLILTR